MDEIKEQVGSVVKDRGFVATLAAMAVTYAAKRFTKDLAGSVGAGLVVYSLVRKL